MAADDYKGEQQEGEGSTCWEGGGGGGGGGEGGVEVEAAGCESSCCEQEAWSLSGLSEN